jgi:flagellar biosynthesis/type III secretory pathway M-ring protein FliF/YscJ
MPIYLYQNPETEEVKEIIQTMNEEHVYQEDGVDWKRIFTKPNASIQSLSSLDPFNKRDFIDKTGNMKGTVGDMMGLAEEMSAQRSEKTGTEDPVKRKFFDNYEKNIGKKHLADKPKRIERNGISVDLD